MSVLSYCWLARVELMLLLVPDRTAYTLLSVLLTRERPVTKITTDCFLNYCSLPNTYTPLTVNNSAKFVDSKTYACTNATKVAWVGIKTRIGLRNSTSSYHKNGEKNQNEIDVHLREIQWIRKNNIGRWNQFIIELRIVEYTEVLTPFQIKSPPLLFLWRRNEVGLIF
ncbi:hypothetical protein HZS_1673 [Henneguya salminicola]|nr:hypothetical protein HZS_1673 [Henneguya salminicola]